ncbi:translation initiation factor IF-2 [Candidatus Woesearchaeota archaeon]|nr:translation initiation factor IF-2 [Candidatus Woesearchaeota archaeon]
MAVIRSPICAFLGHVDHGKSSILDKVRGSCIVDAEAGKITQSIGASIIPLDVIRQKCGSLLKALKMDFTIQGLLFIDTPGHAAFTTLRKRGGSLSDIAIVVIDMNEGFKPQTVEAIEILRASKTPFIIAANKIDLVPGWRSYEGPLLAQIAQQSDDARTKVDTKLYELVGQINERFGMNSERFDRVEDYTSQIAIVPCSAKTGSGIPELLMVIAGLAQRYLEKSLKIDVDGAAKGTIMEVKESKGMGKTLDVIIYDGALKVNDTIVIGTLGEPIVTKVRALFQPAPLAEMRDRKSKFSPVKSVSAAIGVKISAPNIEAAISGMPIVSCNPEDVDRVKEDIRQEVDEALLSTEKNGIIIKADTLGSLEAMHHLLKEKGIPIRKAAIGHISKKDVSEAESNFEEDPLTAVILGFNICMDLDVKETDHCKILLNDVIYRLLEDYEKWKQERSGAMEKSQLEGLVRPCKLMLMAGYVFRQNNPAIVGTEVTEGTVKSGMQLMKPDGKPFTTIKSLQLESKTISSADRGKQVAVAYEGVTVGRQINERDILYSFIPEEDFRKLKDLKSLLKPAEIALLKEIADIMRKSNPLWGV